MNWRCPMCEKRCREARERQKRYRERHGEKLVEHHRAYQRAYYRANRELVLEKQRNRRKRAQQLQGSAA